MIPLLLMKRFLFTSESVGEGHPDKICDQISDAIVDYCLGEDPDSKVAIETMVKSNTVILCGEISTNAKPNYAEIVKRVIKHIGYHFDDVFDYKTVNVLTFINRQSKDIAQAVQLDPDEIIGAGDQGIMFGYATNETEEKMPLSLVLAHDIVRMIKELTKKVKWLRPDCKSQVTLEYENNNGELIPIRVDNIVVSCHHSDEMDVIEVRDFLKKEVLEKVIDKDLLFNTKFFIQPSGRFLIGGPTADSGLTGRKIIVDTYGGFGAHGGGCFSGKDCSKVDRSGAYAARWIAKSLVYSGLCKRVLVQISYAIGISEPTSLYLDTYGTGIFSNDKLLNIIKENFDLRPNSIVRALKLREPIFQNTACFGHFGNPKYTWERPKKLKYESESPIDN
ncbi:methionine adenosyltransferase [Edhazardia aedis USNM 41457]|uniref:S-adenosylmethionine synthase n=1 Tax=Edhazardia aedis (strain USNM 41457) TaxID=1003232 RepID=J9DL31_EDHAE|nr:methionine adenosyltransferase [Edhazardia aedis USNM 41457]|eukprot:EJW03305.1 methionine adenosyltransferase [Edhazardia aedis USNM 41457]